ncbi:hypothetical protein GN244_ATG12261 [Phytophthora infestans]|uniref:Uncharacterized protein n=1 Tax=Phytophthora infestans TaxID=4787 RepID=A0A833T0C6_PHYIN|nr:hypothetical protein GN244_ATG12261 [Phytophthora infestans]
MATAGISTTTTMKAVPIVATTRTWTLRELRNASEETYFIRLRVIGAYMPRQAADGTQSLHVAFVASPVVLRGLYSFGFGLGLSIMHCRRASWTDGVAASGKGMNLWNFLSKNKYPTAPKVFGLGDLISSLTALTSSFATPTTPGQTQRCLLAYWINKKFSLFRNKVLLDRRKEATKVSTQFCRSDDKLGALRDSSQSWKPSSASRPRPTNAETNSDPPDVYAQMPLGEDGRKRCLKFLSKPGCQFTKCSNAHFRPESLAEGVKNLISERWGGLSARYIDL